MKLKTVKNFQFDTRICYNNKGTENIQKKRGKNMLKHYFKTLILMSAFTLFLCCSIDQKSACAAKTVFSFGSGSYTIINGKEVQYEGLSEKAYTVADIPDTVELKGKSY